MTPKTDLFELIKAMSKNEKGYFKRFCTQQDGEKKYLLLFDFIEQQEVYNEQELIKTFKKEKFVKNFSVAKSYLYDTIMDSMHNYHAKLSSETTLNRMLNHLEILYFKGLYKQCNEVLKRMFKIAQAHEKHYHIIQYHVWKLKLFNTLGYKGLKRDDLHALVASTTQVLGTFSDGIKLNMLGNELTFLLGKEGSTSEKGINKEIERLVKKIDSETFREIESVRLKIFQKMMILYYLFYVKRDIESSFKNVKDCLDLFHQNEKLIEEELTTYIATHVNMIVVSGRPKYSDTFFKTLNRIREINETYKALLTPKQRASIFERSYISELAFYIRSHQFKKIDIVIDEITLGMEQHQASSSDIARNILLGNIGIMYYCNDNIKQALKWLYRLINLEDITTRPDTIGIAKMLCVIIHFEMHNYDIIENEIRLVRKFLQQNKLLTEVENKILEYILLCAKKQPAQIEIKKITERTIHEIETHVKPQDTENWFYFDFITWLKSKTKNITYGEALKEQSKIT